MDEPVNQNKEVNSISQISNARTSKKVHRWVEIRWLCKARASTGASPPCACVQPVNLSLIWGCSLCKYSLTPWVLTIVPNCQNHLLTEGFSGTNPTMTVATEPRRCESKEGRTQYWLWSRKVGWIIVSGVCTSFSLLQETLIRLHVASGVYGDGADAICKCA